MARRRSSSLLAVVVSAAALAVVAMAPTSPAFAREKFASPKAALEQGLAAYRAGYFPGAIDAFEFVRDKDDKIARLFAEFYLARIYADNSGPQTDHAKAYMLFQRIAEENAETDPDDLPLAPVVAKSLTALAGYVKRGLPEAHVAPDPQRAAEFLRIAANTFDEPDAQFELAKMLLIGDGVTADPPLALHFLSKLVQDSHPGAQAFLAELHWHGKHVPKDQNRALGLIEMAAENAPPSERLWIDEIYQNIFCGAPAEVRTKAKGLVANWRKMFARPKIEDAHMGLGGRDVAPSRTCRNGEAINLRRGSADGGVGTTPVEALAPSTPARTDTAQSSSGYRPAGVNK
jgi:uncharacterized protein